MELKCAENESVIKSWDYATRKQGSDRRSYNLTVTNKRIVATTDGNRVVAKKEIYLKDVKTLDFSFARKGTFLATLLIIFGIILAVAIIGIFMIVKGVRILKERSFTLTITTQGAENLGMLLGASSLMASISRARVKIKVDKNAAHEIIDELGKIVLEQKEIAAAC